MTAEKTASSNMPPLHSNGHCTSLLQPFNKPTIMTMKPFTLPPGDGKRVCVGGGAGFIGSHIARRLKAAGYYVIGT